MSESNFWRKVKAGLSGWDPQRIESNTALGVPDVNHIHGWVELKYLRGWPKRGDTVVAVDHYTQEQRVWHRRRVKCGGRCHVLLGIGTDILLLDGHDASKHLGNVTKDEILELALMVWHDSATMKKELKDAILTN